MFRILIDTCVWFDLAKNPKRHPLVGVIEIMIEHKLLALIVPSVVVEEFRRNRDRIEKDSARSLRSHIQLVKEAVEKVPANKR